MDDVEELGTVTTHTCDWEHSAVVRGRNLLREKGCGLAAISAAAFSQGGFEIKQALPDGYCALHSVSLAQQNSYADSCTLANYRAEIVDECVYAVFGERWDGGEEVSQEAEGMLAKLGFSRGVHRRDEALGGRRRKTNAEVIASIPDQTGAWLAVSQLALVCFGLETNLAVWEAKAGGGIQLYQNEGVLGLFVLEANDNEFVHLLYSNGGCSLEGLACGRYLARDPLGANGAPVTLSHFDNITIPPWFVPFLSAYQPVSMDGISPSNTMEDKAGETVSTSCSPGFSKQVPPPATKPAPSSTDSGEDTATTSSRPPPPSNCVDADDTSSTAGPLEKTPLEKTSYGATVERCTASYASGKKRGEPCEQPVKAGCGSYCGLHKGKNVVTKRRRERKKRRTGDGACDEVAQYDFDPEGDASLSDDGSEAEFPGDGADFDDEDPLYEVARSVLADQEKVVAKVEESWGRKALQFMFSLVNATDKLENDRQTKREAREEADQAVTERLERMVEGDDILRDESGCGGGDGMRGERGGQDGEAKGGKKGGVEGSAGTLFEEDIDPRRWCSSGMKGVDWAGGYKGVDNEDDESKDRRRSEYEGTGFEYDECHRRREGAAYSEQFRPSQATLKSLPRFDEDNLGRFTVDVMGKLALTFFYIMFPVAAIKLLVEKTNEYHFFCTRQDIEPKNRQERHRQKKSFLGRARWPKHGISTSTMLGVFGIVITFGLVKLPQISDHWDIHSYHDFKLVRDCMTRDMFGLIYCRFFHMASAGAPKRLRDGTCEEGWDALHHIRPLETLLNKAWSGSCVPGRYISFDEQMVLCRGRASKFMQKHMPAKPIKNGIKIWAVTCWTGLCLCAYTDGGYKGDPRLRKWATCPIGRTARMVLFVLFGVSPILGQSLLRSGVYMACDNYFTSPILFVCLLWHGVYAVGTLRENHRGTKEAIRYWSITKQHPKKKGEMAFARFGFLALAQWVDSKLVRFLSTIHIRPQDFRPRVYSKNMAGSGMQETGVQPWCRFHYNLFMGGVDIADQLNGCYLSLHKAKNYFWRRVFEQKLMQSCTNGWLMYKWWLQDMMRSVEAAIVRVEARMSEVGDCADLQALLDGLRQELARLEVLGKQTRCQWLRALSVELMYMCQKGCSAKGGKRGRETPARPKTVSIKGVMANGSLAKLVATQRLCCESRLCASRTTPVRGREKHLRGKKVTTACLCLPCSKIGGVVMCKECHGDEKKHLSAFKFAASPKEDGTPRDRPELKFCKS